MKWVRRVRALALACAGVACSSGASEGAPTINGCTPEMFVTAPSKIAFGGSDASPLFGYSPMCLHVTPGAAVTFSGDLSVHPLSPRTSPTATAAGSPDNPIPQTNDGSSITVTFPAAGTYPYFCQMHYAAGMTGVVWVE